MTTQTVHLHRVLRAPAERIYRAFLDPDAMARWLPPYGFLAKVHQMEAQVGGSLPHVVHSLCFRPRPLPFGGSYLELVPYSRIRYTATFDDPNLPGQMQTTVTLTAVSCGTDIQITQEGIPAMIPAEACHLGWQESLLQLARLVEPEIPG